MLANPATKYVPFAPFARDFSERTWPSRRIAQARSEKSRSNATKGRYLSMG